MRLLSLFLLVISVAFGGLSASETEALAKMDRAAPKFKGMKAALLRTTYTQVIDDTTKEKGEVAIGKRGGGLQMLLNVTASLASDGTTWKSDPKAYSFKGDKGEVYFPNINTVQEYDLGKNSSLLEHLLLLGFGTGGRELRANYLVNYVGEETVAGSKTFHVQLTPKAAAMKEKVHLMDLWMHEDGAYPVQQKILLTSDNYYLFTYSGIQYNPPLTDAELVLKLPRNVKRERP